LDPCAAHVFYLFYILNVIESCSLLASFNMEGARRQAVAAGDVKCKRSRTLPVRFQNGVLTRA
jgi:hypothetical protein